MNLPHNIDFNYIFSHCDQSKFEIPHYYDKQNWELGETYRMRVSNIYDPSKFWIVVKEQELDVFQRFLADFYNKYSSRYKMSLNSISENMYCTAFTENAFYRGLIVSIPHSLTLDKKVIVFLFDFGYTCMVNLEDIYYLSEKFYEVPRFAVRASLSDLQPHSEHVWNYEVVKRFDELVSKKVLICVVECTDPSRRIVFIKVGSVKDELSDVVDIGITLISEKLARSTSSKKSTTKIKNNSRYIPTTNYPHLFPSFEAIEGGIVPSSVYISEMLRQCVARDVLFKPYFAYKGTSEK
ncbi:uncharacterized protein LOC108917822 [Anoplophora glabripennis]|uniref:uncharacterized protein LOC108917822 n=1 Tax=Anoplophora glabripennis TaxID=217634 RepID=UPI000873A909|nr:uncharacterized protein LOC108917822 [Anoplophora glabripennis]